MFGFFKLKPFNEGFLPPKDGHEIYFREFGNKNGDVVLYSHGGPGYFSRSSVARLFDLKKHRVIMFDQRGCGKSKYVDLLKNNTIQHTISDMANLLDYLNIDERVVLYGSSFGTTVSLLFAQEYPDRVKKLILKSVFLAREEDLRWDEDGSKIFYPEIVEEIKKYGSDSKSFYNMITSDDEKKQKIALKYYSGYECVLGSLNPCLAEADLRYLSGARISLHYIVNNFFVKDNQILKNVKYIKNIPILIVHNRLDFVCPVIGAYELSKLMNKSKLVVVPDIGHGSKKLNKILKSEIKLFESKV